MCVNTMYPSHIEKIVWVLPVQYKEHDLILIWIIGLLDRVSKHPLLVKLYSQWGLGVCTQSPDDTTI